MRKRSSAAICGIFIAVCVQAACVQALPFNDDMVDVQLRTGLMMRPLPAGSVARGTLADRIENKQQAEKLKNPLAGDVHSAARGRMLFMTNCSPCHGDITKSYPDHLGPVAAKFMPPPDIAAELYKTKSDGYIYGTIHFGGLALMPPLGWKLSALEHWDIVNYVRSVQNAKK